MNAAPRLVLASASPARRALLRAAGLTAEVHVSDVDEVAVEAALGAVSPARLALELAVAKAASVAAVLGPVTDPPTFVVGADTLLDLDGSALGRPADDADAAARWRALRGRVGVLLTGHAVQRLDTGETAIGVGRTVVRFGRPTDAQIEAYVATGEPASVAGAFTLDGLGGTFIEGVDGDPSNVTGLSLPLLRRLLADLGVEWTSLWQAPDRPSRWD